MKNKRAIIIGLLGLLLHSLCAGNSQALEKIVNTKTGEAIYARIDLIRVADNVVILFDSSSSMAEPYDDSGMTKLQAAKKLLQQRAALFPDVFPDLKVGLYTYTPQASLNIFRKGYDVFYKMQPLNKEAFLQAVDQLPEKASGPTLLQEALFHLDDLLGTLSGHTVVFLFTDGTASNSDNVKSPVELARNLAQKYDVSFQIISSTEKKKQQELIEKVASINESSRVFPMETLLDRPEAFTGAVFVIEESYVVSPITVEKVVGFKLDHILFDYDKSEIKNEFTQELNAVGEVLQNNPESYVVLAGFTDSMGSEEYNLGLSRQRVEAAGKYLSEKFQIDGKRITTFWYGEAAPVASNDSEEGRQKNRRVIGFIAGLH